MNGETQKSQLSNSQQEIKLYPPYNAKSMFCNQNVDKAINCGKKEALSGIISRHASKRGSSRQF